MCHTRLIIDDLLFGRNRELSQHLVSLIGPLWRWRIHLSNVWGAVFVLKICEVVTLSCGVQMCRERECVCVWICVCYRCVDSTPDDWKCAFNSSFITLLSSFCTSENHVDVIKCESYLFALLRIFVHFWTCFNINVVSVSFFFLGVIFFKQLSFTSVAWWYREKKTCIFNWRLQVLIWLT